MAGVLGLDTSNYTTSAAWFDGTGGDNTGKLLEVPQGALGLRQSEALFQHVKRLPAILEDLKAADLPRVLTAIGASTRPREVEGSYMPCFLAGESQGKAMASVLEVPFYACSHQQGHIARRGVVRGENGFTGSAAFGLASLRRHDRVTVRGARWRYGAGDLHRRDLGYFRRSADRPNRKEVGTSISRGESGGRAVSSGPGQDALPCKSFGLHLFFLRNREQNERIGGGRYAAGRGLLVCVVLHHSRGGNRHTASAGALSGASRPLRRRGSFQSAVAAENDKSMRSGVCGTAVFHRQCHGGSHPHLAHTQ